MKDTKIESEEDFKSALEEIFQLCKNGKSNTSLAKLQELVAKVHEYEEQNYPM